MRVGDTVRRPWTTASPATQALLAHLADALPGSAPIPLGRDDVGREVSSWLDGDVGIPPYPGWVADERFLVSVGELLRDVHDALAGWTPPSNLVWAPELRDPRGGSLIVHADICPENVVTRGGLAVGLLDWEFAAPGRRVWDVVSTARLCVPFVAPDRRPPVYDGLDAWARLHVFLDAYRLGTADRAVFTDVLAERRTVGERFVRGRVARGEAAFAERWGTAEGERLLAVERAWVDALPEDVAR